MMLLDQPLMGRERQKLSFGIRGGPALHLNPVLFPKRAWKRRS